MLAGLAAKERPGASQEPATLQKKALDLPGMACVAPQGRALWLTGGAWPRVQVQVVAGELRRQVTERVDCLAANMGNHEAATRDPNSLIFRSNPWVRPGQACPGSSGHRTCRRHRA